jgi:Transposase DDE domain
VVADILYGEHRGFRKGLEKKRIPYVLALKPSYAWYRPITEPGTVEEIARVALWEGPDDPGEWVKLSRTFRDGRTEEWWALAPECRPFGKEKPRRLVVATTDPAELPERTTWYLLTNLPAPGSSRATESELIAAEVAEVVRLYSLRSWIEQSYKQVKNSLGWAHYQVRSDPAIRRHWQLVCCAFTFCWWANTDLLLNEEAPPGVVLEEEAASSSASSAVERGKKGERKLAASVLARGTKEGEDVAGAVRNAVALLEGVLREAPAERTATAA